MQTDTSTNMDLNMTNTKENKKQYIKICICIYTMMRFGALEGGKRMQTPRQTLDKSQVTFAALPLFATKQYNTIQRQHLPKKYNINTNICLHGHLHNYYQKVVIQATVISAHLATFEATQKGDHYILSTDIG